MGLWRYSLPIEERGWYEGLRKGLTALVWLLNIFDDVRAIYDYLISFHYKYSLYCLYLKFYCARTAAIGNAIPAVLVEREKKMVSAHLSGEKSDGRVNLRMCLSWGMHWIRKSSSHAFKSTRFGVNHVIFFYFLHCLSGHSILTSFAVSTQSRLHLSLSLSPLSLLDRFISYLFAWSLMSLTPLVSSLSPITVWFTYANLFLY